MVQVEVRPHITPTAVPHVPALWSRVPGLAAVLALAAIAVPLGRLVPVVGGPVVGILLGVLSGLFIPALRAERCRRC